MILVMLLATVGTIYCFIGWLSEDENDDENDYSADDDDMDW